MLPGAGGVRLAQPEPAGLQGVGRTLQVRDAKAAVDQGAADLGPADEAVASINGLASLPEESAEETIHLTKDGRVQRHGDQNVGGHRTEHMSDEGQPLAAGQHRRPPWGELLLHLLDEGLEG